MTAGRDIQLEVDRSGTGQFIKLTGVKTRSFNLSSAQLDTSHIGSPEGWRELAGTGGLRAARIEAAGIVKDQMIEDLLLDLFSQTVIAEWRIAVSTRVQLSGLFN
jgi:predicted secreted protein